MRESYVRSRYEALAAMRDVFRDLVIAEQVYLEGCLLRSLHIRRDLAAQEVIESLPARTTFSAGLFTALPVLRRAVLALHSEFEMDAWIGLPISDFMSEYVRLADPDSTVIVSGLAGAAGDGRAIAFTLGALWTAVPEAVGGWRFADGTMVRFLTGVTEDANQTSDQLVKV